MQGNGHFAICPGIPWDKHALVPRFFRACAVPTAMVVCALALTVLCSAAAHASVTPRVLAFYYAWYDANTWNRSLVSDLPSQPYASNDPAAITRQIQQAQNAGIDAFVVSWIGLNNPTDSNFKLMLGAAQSAHFAATIDFETQHFASRGAVVSALAYVRDTFMSHAAFLRDGGKPVLFFWREQNFSVGDWAAIRAQVDPNHQQLWIAEGVDIAYQQVFDGHHLYSIAWSPNVNATLDNWAGRVRRAGGDKLWVATVMPGYDDTRTARPDRFARSRDAGNFYRATWEAALASKPDFIIINSFNEWVEGTMIEAGTGYGNLYLDLTRDYAAQFKTGGASQHKSGAAAGLAPPPTVQSPATTEVPLGSQQRRTTDILRVRVGPGKIYPVLGRLRADHVIDILARTLDSQWLEIPYPDAKRRGWVKAEFVAPESGFDSFPVASAPPLPRSSSAPGADTSPDAPPIFLREPSIPLRY